MLEKVIPDEKILEIIEEFQRKTQEAKTYNVIMIFKDFCKKKWIRCFH